MTSAPQTTPNSLILRHMPSLDSIRGVAVLLVLMFHGFGGFGWRAALGGFWGPLASASVGCGRFGVNVFFVLSGFLITTLLFKARERKDFYQDFYKRRVLRILPAYLLLLVVIRAWGFIDNRFLLAALLFIANFSMLFGAPMNEFGSLWSLAVEEHFYLLWPTCVRRLRERTLFWILLATVTGEPVLRLTAIYLLRHIDIHYKTPFVLDFIAYGALLALLLRRGRVHAGNAGRVGGALLLLGGVLGLVTIYLSAFHMGKTVDALADLPFTWAACGALLLGLKRDHARLLRTGRTDSRGVLPFYGYISYGLYLINVIVYIKLGGLMSRHTPRGALGSFWVWTAQAMVCIAVATGVAWLSRRYFEESFLRLKDRWTGRAQGAPLKPHATGL